MTIRGQGVTPRLLAFFRANPNEELTLDDVIAKFDCTPATARKALCVAGQKGAIERVSVYRLRTPR